MAASRPGQDGYFSAKRLLALLPNAPQTESETPYLDTSLFRYDDKAMSAQERNRNASDFPVRFYSRRTDHLVFRLNSGPPPDPVGGWNNPYRVK